MLIPAYLKPIVSHIVLFTNVVAFIKNLPLSPLGVDNGLLFLGDKVKL